ncbi:MAG: 4-hydroxythreonine-4-phosphate dehydrogenase PdxA, partial [Anaerolineales bacterium]
AQLLVIGNRGVMERAASTLGMSLELELIETPGEIERAIKRAYLLEQPPFPTQDFPIGRIDANCGRAAANYIFCAVELAARGEVDAIATAPINKASFQAAGIPYRGHTELLADKTHSQDVAMMLVTPGRAQSAQWLRVTHATSHIPLVEVPHALTLERILKIVSITVDGLKQLRILKPRLALAALNPHASDEGLMGDEEARLLVPAVAMAKHKGINLEGPIPADTVFLRAIQGEFDAVIALYHDQGHIPIKTHGFERAVNITLGLPIIRTSVDHGTAFDIAWKGIAQEDSMIEAILLAAQMASHSTGV